MKIFVLTLVLVLTGCATGSSKYAVPRDRGMLPTSEYEIKAPFDKSWDSIVAFTQRKFFTVTSKNKESGSLILTFGGTQPGKYVDCGRVPSRHRKAMVSYIGSAKLSGTVELVGTMKLFMKPIDGGKTKVSFNTRYDLTIKEGDMPSQNWKFASNESLYRKVGELKVMCMPTYVAEVDIISGFKSVFSGH